MNMLPAATETGQAIRALRHNLGLSQVQLAERLGVWVQTVGRWERTGMVPCARSFAALAELGPIAIPPKLHREAALKRQWELWATTAPAGRRRARMSSQDMTIAQYAAQRWLPLIATQVRPATLAAYRSYLARRILPALGERPLASVTRKDVRAWMQELLKQGVAPGTTRVTNVCLASLYEAAIEDELVDRNPCREAGRRLKLRRYVRPRRALSLEELSRFFTAAERVARALVPFWQLAVVTAARNGELCALRTKHVDLDASTLELAETYHGRACFGPPKSRPRTVDLTPRAIAILRALVAHARPPAGFLFPSPVAAHLPITPRAIQRATRRVVKAAGLERGLTTHCLRHTAASELLAAGTSPQVVQRLLGHHSVQVTLDVYGCHWSRRNPGALARVDELLP